LSRTIQSLDSEKSIQNRKSDVFDSLQRRCTTTKSEDELACFPGSTIPRSDLETIHRFKSGEHHCFATAMTHRAIDVIEEKRKRNAADLIVTQGHKSLKHAIKKMLQHGIGCLLVENDKKQIHGILYEKAVYRKLALSKQAFSLQGTKVHAFMCYDIPIVKPSQSVAECLQNFLDYETQYIVVKNVADRGEDGCVLGVLSIGDIIESILTEYESTIAMLQDYITRADFNY